MVNETLDTGRINEHQYPKTTKNAISIHNNAVATDKSVQEGSKTGSTLNLVKQ